MRAARSSQLLPSARSSLIATSESVSSALYAGAQFEPTNQSSAKKFLQACPYRIELDDRTDFSVIKRREMETCLQRLSAREDVHGVLVATIDGRILYPSDVLKEWISSLAPLCEYARDCVRNLDPNDTIRAVRLRTRKYEIIVTMHEEQLLIVMQIVADPRTSHQIDSEEDLQAFLKRIGNEKVKY